MLLASVIAWRNEPAPLSLVFMTVKTKGNVTVFGCWLAPWMLPEVERSPRRLLNAFPRLEASTIEKIDAKATTNVIRNAKAAAGLFFFIFVLWGEVLGTERAGITQSRAEGQA